MNYYIGIDPGLSGGVAMIDAKMHIIALQETPTVLVKKGKKNKTLYVISHMVNILENMKQTCGKNSVHVSLENVHSMPGQGSVSGFSFGTGFGMWQGIIATLRLPVTLVEPTVWKRGMGIASKSDKGASVIRAQQLFPDAQLTRQHATGRKGKALDGIADALLLAVYLAKQP